MKKKIFGKIMAAFLVGILFISVLTGCKASAPVVMEYKGEKITANTYSYWLSSYKSYLMYNLGAQDTDEFWQTDFMENQTMEQYFNAMVKEVAKSNLSSLALFKEYKLSLSQEAKDQVNTKIEEQIQEAGGRSALNSTLMEIGLNVDMLKEVYLIEAKVSAVYDYLYGENGVEKITETQKDGYYKDNYARVNHVLIRTSTKDVLDADGNPVANENGSAKTEPLTEEEKAAKLALVDTVMAEINSGENFEDLIKKYSEDPGSLYYADGYYVSLTNGFDTNFTSAALAMEVGEVRKVESSFGVHVMKKYDLIEKAYTKEANADFFGDMENSLVRVAYDTKITPIRDAITVNEEELATFSIRTAAGASSSGIS